MLRARERLRGVFAAAGLGLTIPGPFHELRPGSSVHYAGSLRMHASAEFGVVDGWNRVHDVPNVIVGDSSSDKFAICALLHIANVRTMAPGSRRRK